MNTTDNFLEVLSERVRLNPDSHLFLSLAEEYKKHQRIEDAIDTLAEGLRKNPSFIPARVKLALWYAESNMPAEAIREAEKVLAIQSDNVNALKIIFRIAKDLGDNEKALQQAKTILSLRPYDEETRSYLQNNQVQSADLSSPNRTDSTGEELNLADPLSSVDTPKNLHQELRQTEILIEQGRFREASMLCNLILSDYPRDRKALQRKEEISSLLSLIRKKTEAVIEKLEYLKQTLINRVFHTTQ